MTDPHQVMGTPDYLSPEQAQNSHGVDPRSDIYSLGCTLYFLLTARPPFLAAATRFDKLLAHAQDEPPAIREVRPEVPEGLAEVLAKMMAKNPADRYQKASHAAADLLPFTRSDAAKEPAFEIVEAEMAPLAVSRPPAGTGMLPEAKEVSDTAPPGEPTLTDTPRPKRARKKKKKRASWWQRQKWTVLAGIAALGLLAAGVILVSGGTKHTDKAHGPPSPSTENSKIDRSIIQTNAGKIEQNNPPRTWTPPTDITPPRDVVVLYVIPSSGLSVPDYSLVREQLELQRPGKPRVRVETAATSGGRSQPASGSPGDAVPIDVQLTEGMNLNRYDAVVFCGFDVDEYLARGGRGAPAAGDLIDRMLKANKPVAAICGGQAVLRSHNALTGRKAAILPPFPELNKYAGILKDPAIAWQNAPPVPVVTDNTGGKIVITAIGARQAKEFAAAILKAIER